MQPSSLGRQLRSSTVSSRDFSLSSMRPYDFPAICVLLAHRRSSDVLYSAGRPVNSIITVIVTRCSHWLVDTIAFWLQWYDRAPLYCSAIILHFLAGSSLKVRLLWRKNSGLLSFLQWIVSGFLQQYHWMSSFLWFVSTIVSVFYFPLTSSATQPGCSFSECSSNYSIEIITFRCVDLIDPVTIGWWTSPSSVPSPSGLRELALPSRTSEKLNFLLQSYQMFQHLC